MKKIGSMIFLLLFLLILSSCSQNTKEKNDTTITSPDVDRPVQRSVTENTDSTYTEPIEDNDVIDYNSFPYHIETIATDLDVPWDMDIANDGRIFFTERIGAVRVIQDGELLMDPVFTIEDQLPTRGEGGLLGIVLDPQFDQNHYMYIYHTYINQNGDARNKVLRLKEANNKATIDKILVDDFPGSVNHNGGRIKIGPDHKLYVTVGEIYQPPLAQDLNNLGGKILRFNLDGSIPEDNPFPNSPIYSFGHRNPQGLDWQPGTELLFSSEHGQTAHDEINVIYPGGNYGWPVIQGDESKEGMISPIIHSGDVTWAPSGITFVSKGPWKGSLLAAGLRGNRLYQFIVDSEKLEIIQVNEWLAEEYGRLRNIYEGPDGSLYLMTNNRDGRGDPQDKDDRIIRFVPRNE